MTYADAQLRFDAMDANHKSRVTHTFDLIRNETGFPSVRDAFIAAVEDECKAIETESFLSGVPPRQ